MAGRAIGPGRQYQPDNKGIKMALSTKTAGALIQRKEGSKMAKDVYKINLLQSTVCGGERHRLEIDEKTGEPKPKKIEASKADALLLIAMEKAEPGDAACKKMVKKSRGL